MFNFFVMATKINACSFYQLQSIRKRADLMKVKKKAMLLEVIKSSLPNLSSSQNNA